MIEWSILIDALLESAATPALILFAIWLDLRLERNIQEPIND